MIRLGILRTPNLAAANAAQVMVVVAPRMMARVGVEPMVVGGLLPLAAGLVALSFGRANGTFAVDVLPASLVAAAGMALAFIPSLQTAISSARPEGGLASGTVNTGYPVGSALGLAAMTALAAAHGADQVGNGIALTDGYGAAFLCAAGIAPAGGLLAAVMLRRPQAPAADTSPVAESDRELMAA